MTRVDPKQCCWVRKATGKLTIDRVPVTLLDAFCEALRQGVIGRGIADEIPRTLYEDLLSKPACDFIQYFQVLLNGETSGTVAEGPRKAMLQAFQEVFKLAAQLFAGYPLSCQDFRKGFPFTSLPSNVQNRIIGFLVPVSETFGIEVVDAWPNCWSTVRQTKYSLEDQAGRSHETTYGVFSRSSRGKVPDELDPFLTSNVHRRHVHSLQYADGIVFHGSPESVSAFMHDRMTELDLMTNIEINYRFRRTELFTGFATTPTKPGSWRKLSNMLVHDCIGLKNVKVVVDKLFWDKIKWNTHAPNHYATAEQLIRLPKKSSKETGIPPEEEEDRPCGFLEKIGRLSNERHLLKVVIDGADTEDKKQFQRVIKSRMYHCMGTRPAIAEAKEGCRCQTKVLWDCCAWNPPEGN